MAKRRRAKPRGRREMPLAVARRLRRMKVVACLQLAIGGSGVAAALALVLTGHLAIGALPLIAGGIVMYRGERRLSRVDAVARKHLYGAAAGVYGGHSGCGGGGFMGCAAGCTAGGD